MSLELCIKGVYAKHIKHAIGDGLRDALDPSLKL